MTIQILFAGLGRMGFPMAGHLSKNTQYHVTVYNRSPQKINNWLSQYSGDQYPSSQQFDVIILCVGNDEDVISLVGENGLFSEQLKTNGVIIDHTTTSAKLPLIINRAIQSKNAKYLDAPVSGGEAGAINGVLSAMVGGDISAFQQIEPILKNYCKSINHIGESGSGQIAKMANQFCIAGILAGLSEAIVLLEKSGLDAQKVFKAIKGGAAQSWQMDNRFETMIAREFDFGFSIEHMIKDLNYGVSQAEIQNWSPELAIKTIKEYELLLTKGNQGRDTSVLVEQHREKAK